MSLRVKEARVRHSNTCCCRRTLDLLSIYAFNEELHVETRRKKAADKIEKKTTYRLRRQNAPGCEGQQVIF